MCCRTLSVPKEGFCADKLHDFEVLQDLRIIVFSLDIDVGSFEGTLKVLGRGSLAIVGVIWPYRPEIGALGPYG